jgi:exodeoxyribonuclease VIII
MNDVLPRIEHKGLVFDLPIDLYHASPALSNSGITDLLRTPLHYYALHMDPDRPEEKESSSQLHGTLAHCAILEPEAFDQRYIVGPSVNRSTKVWKEFVATHPGRTAIQADQRDAAMRQAESVRALAGVGELLGYGAPEVSAFWTDEQTQVYCRCRPDYVFDRGDGVILLDVKTYSDASADDFERQVARQGYHRQDWWYSNGYALASGRPVLEFIFVAVESEWPYAASAMRLDLQAKERARAECELALAIFSRCTLKQHWPGYPNAITTLSLPRWLLEKSL